MIKIHGNYKIGDVLRCEKGFGITHVGLVVGVNSVFHNSPEHGEHVSTLADFSKGRAVTIQSTKSDPNLVLAKVRQRLLAPRKYSVISNNCEHSIAAVLEGVESSSQLQGFCLMTVIGILVYLSSR